MEIKYLNAAKSTLETNKALWELSSKKTLIILSFLLAFSLFLAVYGALHANEFSKNESYRSESNVEISIANHYSNRHILESIGIVMTLGLIGMFYYQNVKKKLFFRKVEENMMRFLETGNEYSIRIDENMIEYSSADLNMKMRWILFSKYKIYKDYIFLGLGGAHQIITIDKRLLSGEELDNLFKLLRDKDVQKIK